MAAVATNATAGSRKGWSPADARPDHPARSTDARSTAIQRPEARSAGSRKPQANECARRLMESFFSIMFPGVPGMGRLVPIQRTVGRYHRTAGGLRRPVQIGAAPGVNRKHQEFGNLI